MQYYTFTTWEQVLSWIKDNSLMRWAFAAQRDADGKMSQFVANSEWYPGEAENKIEQTRKALTSQPGRYLYGTGWVAENKSGGDASCEVMINAGAMGASCAINGIQPMWQQAQPIGDAERRQIADEVRQQVLHEVERRQFEAEKKAFEAEKKEYEAEKASAWGIALGYLKPIIDAHLQKPLGKTAGLDAEEVVHAAPVMPIGNPDSDSDNEPADPEEEDPFTEEEGARLADLMKRFKAVEPDYLRLIEAVVQMAEAGDSTYTMAKGILLKQ